MEDTLLSQITAKAAGLLREMVSIPSYSGEEDVVSDLITKKLEQEGVDVNRAGNNLWALAYPYNPNTPVLMLNSHIDTVRPSQSYTFDPFDSSSDNSVIRGLGSNDAGASVVSMIETYLYFRKNVLPFNLLLAISAEEENSGPNGMKMLYPLLPQADCAVIGEPTKMETAIAERGLIVIDATSRGVSGHAAR
ncbi:MAG: M20/M25/M40 family metallo-hydrolase, partial [Bacteroidales bacterium]